MSRRTAARLYAGGAYDPAAAGGLLAWQRPDGVAVLRRPDATVRLPGSHPALGGGRVAWLEGEEIVLAEPSALAVAARLPAPGAGAVALSDALVAWRTRDASGADALWAAPPAGGPPRRLARSPAGSELGRPAAAGTAVLFHVAGASGSRLLAHDTTTGTRVVLRRERGAQLSNPATDGRRLLYVRATGRQQELRIGPLVPRDTDDDRVIAIRPAQGARDVEHEPGRSRHRYPDRPRLPPRSPRGTVEALWTTALAGDAAYVTRLLARRGEARRADILRVVLPMAG